MSKSKTLNGDCAMNGDCGLYRVDAIELRNQTLTHSNFGNPLALARRTTARMEHDGHNNFTNSNRGDIRRLPSHKVTARSIGRLLATTSGSRYDAAFLESRRRGVLPSQLWHSPAGRRGRSMQVSRCLRLDPENDLVSPLNRR